MWNGHDDGMGWIGTYETCDDCKKDYPMIWIRFDGERFICLNCETKALYDSTYKSEKS